MAKTECGYDYYPFQGAPINETSGASWCEDLLAIFNLDRESPYFLGLLRPGSIRLPKYGDLHLNQGVIRASIARSPMIRFLLELVDAPGFETNYEELAGNLGAIPRIARAIVTPLDLSGAQAGQLTHLTMESYRTYFHISVSPAQIGDRDLSYQFSPFQWASFDKHTHTRVSYSDGTVPNIR